MRGAAQLRSVSALLAQAGRRTTRYSARVPAPVLATPRAVGPTLMARHAPTTTGLRFMSAKPEKENFGSIYVENSPQSYIERLNPVDYGHYHDRYQEMITAELKTFAPKNRKMIAVELGSSYGNTTLTYKCGYKWEAACKAWLNESEPLVNKFDVHVNAVDLSPEALEYGQKRGIFDETFQHDFSQPYSPEIAAKLQEADFVTSIMTTFYIPTERWMEGCYKFLADRTKPKLLVYNVMQAFDQRNLTPQLLFAGIPNWTAKSTFNKHRNFTKIEQDSHNGSKEAWTTTYLVTFHAQEPYKAH